MSRLAVIARQLRNSSSVRSSVHFDVIIVGAGNAAGYICGGLASDAHWMKTHSVGMFGQESEAPYERPALSKAFLHPPGSKVRARLPGFHTCVGTGGDRQEASWYAQNGISFFNNSVVTKVDTVEKQIQIENKNKEHCTYSYGKLILATGARPVTPADLKIPNNGLDVFTIREVEQSMELVKLMEAKRDSIKKVVVVGGGFIGLEAAAALVGWGFDVKLVFPNRNVMSRIFPNKIADRIRIHLSKSRGIEFVSNSRVTKINENSLELSNGDVMEAQLVIFGTGSKLNLEYLDLTRFKMGRDGGLQVNGNMETSVDGIYAVGDIACFQDIRHEHVGFARKSAASVASCIIQQEKAFSYQPYFYSRLFEYTDAPLVFQLHGSQSNGRADEIGNHHQNFENMKLEMFGIVWYDDTDRVSGVLIFNASKKQFEAARRSITQGVLEPFENLL